MNQADIKMAPVAVSHTYMLCSLFSSDKKV